MISRMRRLPSFAGMRAFEATARSLSFTRAAEELGVTQSAVSRQIRKLEQELGVALIERNSTGNALTSSGATLFAALRKSLDSMAQAVRAVSSAPERDVVAVSVAPFFSATWLTPRIMGFINAHPDIDLRLHHSYQPPDYRREQIDLGINWGNGKWPGVTAERVMDGSLAPVCSPEFPDGTDPLDGPERLLSQPLFYEFRKSDWTDWFKLAGVDCPGNFRATRLNDTNALRRAALEGHGVALFFHSLAAEDLALGKLVQPFDIAVDTGDHYFLNHPSDGELRAGAKTFRRWLRAELGTETDTAPETRP